MVHYWSLKTGKEVDSFETGYDEAYDMAVDYRNSVIAVTGVKGEISKDSPKGLRFWDLRTKEEKANWQTEDYFTYLAYSADGQYLIGQGYNLYLWETATQTEVAKLQLGGSDKPILSPDNKYIVTSGFNSEIDGYPEQCEAQPASCNINLYSVQTGTKTREYRGHRGIMNSIVFSPDSKLLASSNSDSTIRIRDVETGQELAVWKQYGVTSIAFTPDGRMLVSVGEDGVIRFWGIQEK